MKRYPSLDIAGQAETLFAIWSDLSTRSRLLYPSDDPENEKKRRWLEPEISFVTNSGMVILLALQFSALFTDDPPRYIFLPFLFCCVFILFAWFVLPRLFGGPGALTKEKLEQFLNPADPHNIQPKRALFRIWKNVLLFSPFSFRHIWWWTLTIGIILAEMSQAVRLDIAAQIDNDRLMKFILELSRIMIIAVIAYIATNIIRELIQLREEYVRGKQMVSSLLEGFKADLESLRNDLQLVKLKINEIPREVERANTALKSASELIETAIGSQKLRQLTDTLGDSESKKRAESLKLTTGSYIDNCVKQLDHIQNFVLQRSLLVVLINFIGRQTKELNTLEKRILTQFSNVATMAREIVKSTYPGTDKIDSPPPFEFYALLVLPPERFLNNTRGESVGDQDWESYLSGNIEARQRGIRQHRYFLSIKSESADEAVHQTEGCEEVKDIICKEVKKQLKRIVELDENGWPLKVRSGDVERYAIGWERPAGREWKYLGDIIGNVYHVPGCCKVIELPVHDFKELQLFDKKSKKLRDYYAVRSHEGQWVFCLESLYDKTFDAAHVRILHSEQDNKAVWELTKQRLDKLFLHNPHVEPIESYT